MQAKEGSTVPSINWLLLTISLAASKCWPHWHG